MISENLARIVNGEKKHARREEKRERGNRLGFRGKNCRVVGLPEDLVARADAADEHVRPVRKRSRRDLLNLHLIELASSEKYLELLQRVLAKGEQIAVVADDLGINRSTARSIVARTRRILTLPLRKKDDR